MNCRLSKKKINVWVIVIALIFCLVLVLNFVIKYRVQFMPITPQNTMVREKRLNKDINMILSAYGLKINSDIVIEDSRSNYENRNETENRKRIFIHATPILYANSKNYTEVETYMEIWLYITEHSFDYEINEIVYYFTAPSLDSMLSPLNPNELYMTKDDFLSLCKVLDADTLSHPKKVKTLADAYVKKSNYKRKPGHVQVN